jgi:di/tricarboxylate transporter
VTIEQGDELYVEGRAEDARRIAEEQSLRLDVIEPSEIDRILGRGLTLVEVTLSPHCRIFGRTVKDLQFRKRHGLNVVAVWRGDRVISAGITDLPLQLGDAFLVSGRPGRIRDLAQDPDFLLLGDASPGSEDVRRAPLAILILLVAILPPLLGWLPLAVSALAAALLMVLTRCVTLEQAHRSVDFTVLFLLIGTIPLGIALDRSGVAAGAAQAILAVHGGLGEAGLLGSLFVLSAILSTTSNNGAAAVILAPVAAEAASAAGGDLGRAFLAVAFGASCTFVLPFAHQCNLMVTGPAGYSTRDFARVGGILSLIVTLTAVALLGA